MSSRANYGIDSPAIVAGLFVLGGLAFSTALVWRLFGDPPLFGQIALVGTGAYFLLTAVGMVSYSKAGKLRVRDQILESTPWRGDERVLDCCGRWLACSSRGDDWRWWISFSQASASGCYRESASPMPCGRASDHSSPFGWVRFSISASYRPTGSRAQAAHESPKKCSGRKKRDRRSFLPNQRLKLTGAAILVFRASTSFQAARQLSLGVPAAHFGLIDRLAQGLV